MSFDKLSKRRSLSLSKGKSNCSPVQGHHHYFMLPLLYSSEIDPDVISQQFALVPSKFLKKGEQSVSRTGHQREIKAKINGWFLSSESKVVSKDIRNHLDWLLGELEIATERLRELQEWPEIKMTINCIWWSAQGQGGPTIWPEQMEKVTRMNLECTFDISFFGEDGKAKFTISSNLVDKLNRLLRYSLVPKF